MALDRPILITGPPRSGKTSIFRVLRQAGEFFAIEEPILVWHTSDRTRTDDCCGAEMANATTIARINANCEQLVKAAGKQRYLDDLPYHALRLPFVSRVMPDARVIHVIRNPMEAVPEMAFNWTRKVSLKIVLNRTSKERLRYMSLKTLSQMAWRFSRNYLGSRFKSSRETWGPVVPGLAEFRKKHKPVEVAAYQWSKMIEIAQRDIESLPELKVMEIRYDQLVAHPRIQVERIAEFAEIEQPSKLITFAEDYLKPDYVHSKQTRESHSDAEWAAIRHIVAPVATRLGYLLEKDSCKGKIH